MPFEISHILVHECDLALPTIDKLSRELLPADKQAFEMRVLNIVSDQLGNGWSEDGVVNARGVEDVGEVGEYVAHIRKDERRALRQRHEDVPKALVERERAEMEKAFHVLNWVDCGPTVVSSVTLSRFEDVSLTSQRNT